MMTADCFYYGTYTPKGYLSLATKTCFSSGKNYAVKEYRPSVKQKLFDEIKKELRCREYDFTDFRTDCGSGGIYSKRADFRIIDGTYCDFDKNVFEEICFDDFDGSDELIEKRKAAVQRAVRFLAACKCINNDMARLDVPGIDLAKINRYSSRLWSQTGGKLKGNVGTEHKRFITCITSDGIEVNTRAFDACERVTVISDRTGACARLVTDRVRRYALSAGYDVISCICPMNVEGGAEHIIIPDLHYGIFVNKYYHKADIQPCRKTFAGRFMIDGTENKNRMDFSFKAYKRLMQEVFSSLETVEYCDSELDKIPIKQNKDELAGKVLQKLFFA